MLSKKQITFFNSLKLKKYRKKNSLFFAEGQKIINDMIASGLIPKYIVTTIENLSDQYPTIELITAKQNDLNKISNLKTSTDLFAVFEMPENYFDFNVLNKNLILFCDNIQNPGNLGTIIRTADWFDINQIICSDNTVDAYNPKVVQASMGSIARVNICYVNNDDFFNKIDKNIEVYGSFLEGENIYHTELKSSGIVVIGNEGNGISENMLKYITKRISIPSFSKNSLTSESLNASIATALICAEFKRRTEI